MEVYDLHLTLTADQYEQIWMAMELWLERYEDEPEYEDIQNAMTALELAWEEAQ